MNELGLRTVATRTLCPRSGNSVAHRGAVVLPVPAAGGWSSRTARAGGGALLPLSEHHSGPRCRRSAARGREPVRRVPLHRLPRGLPRRGGRIAWSENNIHDLKSRYLHGLIGPRPEAAARYADVSPLRRAERVRAPMAMFQGLDWAVRRHRPAPGRSSLRVPNGEGCRSSSGTRRTAATVPSEGAPAASTSVISAPIRTGDLVPPTPAGDVRRRIDRREGYMHPGSLDSSSGTPVTQAVSHNPYAGLASSRTTSP